MQFGCKTGLAQNVMIKWFCAKHYSIQTYNRSLLLYIRVSRSLLFSHSLFVISSLVYCSLSHSLSGSLLIIMFIVYCSLYRSLLVIISRLVYYSLSHSLFMISFLVYCSLFVISCLVYCSLSCSLFMAL